MVTLGRITGVFGVQGWVKVHSYTRPAENILKYRQWLSGDRQLKVEEGRVHGKAIVARLADVGDRDAAIGLMGSEISVERSALPKPKRGEIYWIDLIGCAVVSVSGAELGVIAEVQSNGAQDVMVLRGERERLVPWIAGPIVKSVDLKARRVVVEWEADW